MSGPFSIRLDAMGFPMIRHESWSYHIGLFPVSKYQFEHFMSELGPRGELYTDKWYRGLLEFNPHRSWRRCGEKPWQLFVTGVDYGGIAPFLRFLGKGFRLPTVEEWRALYNVSDELAKRKEDVLNACKRFSRPPLALPARLWIERGLFPLVNEGVLEMVMGAHEVTCIGRPFDDFHHNCWDPTEVRPSNRSASQPLRIVGFRTVCRFDSADQEINLLDVGM